MTSLTNTSDPFLTLRHHNNIIMLATFWDNFEISLVWSTETTQFLLFVQCLFQLSFVCVLSHLTGWFSFLFKLILFYWVFLLKDMMGIIIVCNDGNIWDCASSLFSSSICRQRSRAAIFMHFNESSPRPHDLYCNCDHVLADRFVRSRLTRCKQATLLQHRSRELSRGALLPTEKSIAANKSSTWLAAWLGAGDCLPCLSCRSWIN